MSRKVNVYDVTFCIHQDCYEDCDLNIMNVEDESHAVSAADRYGPGCPLYEYEHQEED
jgi:hypothetical protein